VTTLTPTWPIPDPTLAQSVLCAAHWLLQPLLPPLILGCVSLAGQLPGGRCACIQKLDGETMRLGETGVPRAYDRCGSSFLHRVELAPFLTPTPFPTPTPARTSPGCGGGPTLDLRTGCVSGLSLKSLQPSPCTVRHFTRGLSLARNPNARAAATTCGDVKKRTSSSDDV